MKKIKTIYKHIGYYNNYEDIQSFCEKGGDGKACFFPSRAEKMISKKGKFSGEFIKDDYPEEDTNLIVEEEDTPFYYSSDRKYIFTTNSVELCFEVDVDAEDYDPNAIDCNCFVDVYEFDRIDLAINKDEFMDNISFDDDEIVIGYSIRSEEKANAWSHFKWERGEGFHDWIDKAWREFVYRYSREDTKYLEINVHRCVFSSK